MYSRFSPQFIEACLNSKFTPGEKMPCPRCGHSEVTYRNPRKYLPYCLGLALAAAVLILLGQANLGIGAGLAAIVAAMTIVGTEPVYSCDYCRYSWRFSDVEKWAKAVRRDLETGSGG